MSYTFDIVQTKMASGDFDWMALDLRLLLTENATPYTPSRSLTTVAAVLAVCDELVATGYGRETLTALTDDPSGHTRILGADQVDFAITEAGKDLAGGLLFAFDTDDATSWPVSWHPEIVGVTTGTGPVWVPSNGILQLAGLPA